MGFEGDPCAYYGHRIIEEHHAKLRESIKGIPRMPTISTAGQDPKPGVVGILGAGVGGLYTAMMLESLGLKYEIIEASDRTGGRLYTHKFKGEGAKKYDYYDVGAMRFPLPEKQPDGHYKQGIMKRLGELIIYPGLNEGTDRLQDKLIPYYYKAKEGPGLKSGFMFFNGVRSRISDVSTEKQNFHAEQMGVGPKYIATGVSTIVDDVIGPFARGIVNDMVHGGDAGWKTMMQHDIYSTRAYMGLSYIPKNLDLPQTHLSTNVINWLELFDKSTGWYDRAFTETVLESLAFGSVPGLPLDPIDWKCFDGGSQTLSNAMERYIRQHNSGKDVIHFKSRVICIEDSGNTMTVKIANGATKKYSHVISTLPVPVLRTVNLTNAGLTVKQSVALRQLQYGPSIKVGIRFNSAWWTKDPISIFGGQSFTDRPVRTIVYPSYGDGALSEAESTVLIASYCWTNDAERTGSLIGTDDKDVEEQLKLLVLEDLAIVHGVKLEMLLAEYKEIYAWDWNHSPHTMGAFAFFGPGDFHSLYKVMTTPNRTQRLHFAGEALSTRHAWVVGALDSAWRAVQEYLICSGLYPSLSEKFFSLWGRNLEWTSSKPVSPDEMDSFPGTKSAPGKHDLDNLLLSHIGIMGQVVESGAF